MQISTVDYSDLSDAHVLRDLDEVNELMKIYPVVRLEISSEFQNLNIFRVEFLLDAKIVVLLNVTGSEMNDFMKRATVVYRD